MSKENKLSKSAKAALPIFALFGGQGFASSRNPLTMQSSKKLAGKSVVYINENEAPELPTLGVQLAQQVKSPFAAFTNQAVVQTKNSSLYVRSKAMEFLNNNDLLSSTMTMRSNISGNTKSRKILSDPWEWNTRLPIPTTTSTASSSTCASGATYAGITMPNMFWSFLYVSSQPLYYCYGASFAVYSSIPSNILATCQAMHMACDGQPLPVELMKFEIE